MQKRNQTQGRSDGQFVDHPASLRFNTCRTRRTPNTREKIEYVVPEIIQENRPGMHLMPMIQKTTLLMLADHIEGDGIWSHLKVY